MLFGSKTDFGIEATITSQIDSWVYGNICLWASGEPIGDYTETITLGVAAFYLRRTLCYTGKRNYQFLEELSAEQVLAFKYAMIDVGPYDGPCKDFLEESYINTKITIFPNGCEAFDHVKAVLLEQTNGARFIWKNLNRAEVHEVILPPGKYESVIELFLEWLMSESGEDPLDHLYDGKQFVLAGHFINPTRKEVEAIIYRFGGEIAHLVTGSVFNVIVGNLGKESNPKIIEADALNIPIIRVKDFLSHEQIKIVPAQ